MLANQSEAEASLIDASVSWLDERLPSSWEVSRARQSAEDQTLDGAIALRAPNGTYTTLAVEARISFAPRDVGDLMSGIARSLRALAGHVPLLVVAPWLSARTQELLAAEGFNYLDLTGNAQIKLDDPAVFIRSAGATRNPDPPARGPASMRGARAARLVRLLADVRPPYGVGELASAAGLTAGYVSRLLDAMDRDALVERTRRGAVQDVDVRSLLRAWAAQYEVFKSARAYIAPRGASHALAGLVDVASRTAVTGSFAAVRLAPIAAPSLLVVYCDDVAGAVQTLGLLPADEGADVTLLRPFDEVIWERTTDAGGLTMAAPSQVAVDCLTGNGRMPAEGEALLSWMAAHEDVCRLPSIDGLASR